MVPPTHAGVLEQADLVGEPPRLQSSKKYQDPEADLHEAGPYNNVGQLTKRRSVAWTSAGVCALEDMVADMPQQVPQYRTQSGDLIGV